MNLLNIVVNEFEIRSGHSLSNLAEMLSRPVAFDLQRNCNSLIFLWLFMGLDLVTKGIL